MNIALTEQIRPFAGAVLLGLALSIVTSAIAAEETQRLRGEYTLGHEVNVFCPAINSQCYWLGESTTNLVRDELRAIVDRQTTAAYTPVCVLVEAGIDRDTERSGFAADYDGLITVSRVFGSCAETDLVTPGDLQHHRWLLASIDDATIDESTFSEGPPSLEFAEGMRLIGFAGCNLVNGQAVLREEFLVVDALVSTMMACGPEQDEVEGRVLSILGSESVIRLGADNELQLDSPNGNLRYKLADRVE